MKLLRRRARALKRVVSEAPLLRTRPNDGRGLSPSERLREAISERRGVDLHLTGLPPDIAGRLVRAKHEGEI